MCPKVCKSGGCKKTLQLVLLVARPLIVVCNIVLVQSMAKDRQQCHRVASSVDVHGLGPLTTS